MNILLSRHGQTEWNLQGRVQGHLDSKLTEKGIMDARLLADRLLEYEIDICYSSDQARALNTSIILMDKQDGQIVETKKLRELGVGSWEGMLYEDIKNKYPEDFNIYIRQAHIYQPKNGGEKYESLEARVRSFLEKIKKLKVDTILIVTHGVTYLMLLSLMEGKGLESLGQRKVPRGCSLTKIIYDGQDFKIIFENDISHLEVSI